MATRAQNLEEQVQHHAGHIEALQTRYEEQIRLLELRNNSLETQLETKYEEYNKCYQKDAEHAAEIKFLRNAVRSISTFRVFYVNTDGFALEPRLKKARLI